jgi:hypothetical protein
MVSTGFVPFHMDQCRDDGFIEESINWEDDEDAVAFTLATRRSDGRLQFLGGVAVILRSELDHICNHPGTRLLFGYERAAIDSNSYHGNLLLSSATPKHAKVQIAATLAMHAHVIPQPTPADELPNR